MCEHERLRTVGDRVFCCGCGKELPLEFLMQKSKPAKAEKKAEKADAVEKTDKPTARKRTAKKAV